jgi:hypothetical protein
MIRNVPRALRFGLPVLALVLGGACHTGDKGQPPPVYPSFTLALSPVILSVPAGGGGHVPVTLTRLGGFTGIVTLTLEGAPTGVAGSGTIAAGDQSGFLTLSIAPGVAPQALDTLAVKGQSGLAECSASLHLRIAAALPPDAIPADQVQGSGVQQHAGVVQNTAIAMEGVGTRTSRDASGTVEVRHGFNPAGNPF